MGPVRVCRYAGFSTLPRYYDALFEAAEGRSLYLTRAWFELLATHCLEGNEELVFYGAEAEDGQGTALALLMAQSGASRGRFMRRRTLSSLANWYSGLYAPIYTPVSAENAAAIDGICRAIRATVPRWSHVHLYPLDADSREFSALCDSLRRHGYLVRRRFKFRNWFEPIDGGDFAKYLQNRKSKTRGTIRRKDKRVRQRDDVRFEIFTTDRNIDRAVAAYQQVYDASWKEAEVYADFVPSLIRHCAKEGSLRLGILFIGNEPAAVEFCILASGVATMFKTAYDPRFRGLSVGTVVMMRVLEHVLDCETVREIDFGMGDETYKTEFASASRELHEIVAYDPRSWAGAVDGLYDVLRRVVRARGRSGSKR